MAKIGLKVNQQVSGKKSTYTVLDVINEDGGQGGVYLVEDENGKEWAAKWYWQSKKHQDALLKQKAHIEKLAEVGMPVPLQNQTYVRLVWPLDFISDTQSFGYIMDYLDLGNCYDYETVRAHDMEGKWDHEKLCDMCIKLCHGFRVMHMTGYCYKDINRDNIHFHKETNEIYIVDPDNIAEDDKDADSDVAGTSGFIAPEVLNKKSKPNTKSDLWQIAVLMFFLWFKEHPLEGELSIGELNMEKLYRDPIFIYHPTDKRNSTLKSPDFGWVNGFWFASPVKIRETFTRAFVEGCDATKRIFELEWIRTFEEVRDRYLHICPICQKKVAMETELCGYCRKKKPEVKVKGVTSDISRINVFEDATRTKTIPLKVGDKFSGQDLSPRLKAFKEFGEVISNPKVPGGLAFKNLTFENWNYENPDGYCGVVEPERALVIKHNTKFRAGAGVSLKFKLKKGE